MRICIVNNFYPPHLGGQESYVSNLTRCLAAQGDEVTVYCAREGSQKSEVLEEGARIRRVKAPLAFYGSPVFGPPADFFSESYDIVHANFPGPAPAAASALATELKKTPGVLTWHNDLPAVTSSARLLVRVHDAVSPTYLRSFRYIIATTPAYARTSKTLRKFSRVVRVIPNGVDTQMFHPGVRGDNVRERYSIRGKTVALFVGRLSKWHTYKGLDVLLRAFKIAGKELPDLVLLVVGGGSMLDEYARQAAELGIGERVIFAETVSETDLPEYYAASDFLVLPSRNSSEGFGLVLLEAMSSGKAVIGSAVGGVVDVIQGGKDGLVVPPEDDMALANAITTLSGDPQQRLEMGIQGRRFAESNDWTKIAERTRALYENAL